MARCSCGSLDADPDIGLCFECFCGPSEPQIAYPEPTNEDYCEGYRHPGYNLDENGNGTCYCMKVTYVNGAAQAKEGER